MLFAICIIILIIYLIEDYSIKNALRGISYTQRVQIKTVEPDEDFTIISTIQNRTRRFVSFLRVKETFSTDIEYKATKLRVEKEPYGISSIESIIYLMPKQNIERKIKASVSKRGRYFIYGAKMFEGDFLALKEQYKDFSLLNEIVVIPKEINVPDIEERLSGFLGDCSVRRFILEDPVLTVGFNDYTGNEPQKMISWTQSARLNKLMVKNYDYTLEFSVTVILNIECSCEGYEELIEKCYSICRTVCQQLEQKNVKFSFITNAAVAGATTDFDSMDDGSGEHHLMTILECLGRATYKCAKPFDYIINKVIDLEQQDKANIVITPTYEYLTRDKLDALRELSGQEVLVICADEEVAKNDYNLYN